MNKNGTVEEICYPTYDSLTLQWMDFFNSAIIPFIFMIALSIYLVHCIRASRSRVQKLTPSSFVNRNNTSITSKQLRRDNRFAILIVSLNLLFLVLNLPLVIDDILLVYNPETDRLFDYFSEVLYFLYYAIDFYTQIVVNIEFRRVFFKMISGSLKFGRGSASIDMVSRAETHTRQNN